MRIRIVLSRGQQFVRQQVLDGPTIVVGRDPACDVVIADNAVSRQHVKIEVSEAGLHVEDLGSRNGIRVNGLPTRRQQVQHLDIIEVGDHQMHLFVEAMPTDDALDVASAHADADVLTEPLPGAAPGLDSTQPGTTPAPGGPVYVLRRIDRTPSDAALLAVRTVVGEPGRAALIVRRKDKLVLTKLSRVPLNVNGIEIEGASYPVDAGDTIEVGAVRYELVRVD